MVLIDRMKPGEAEALGQIMWDAIHREHSHYTPAQRMAWLPASATGEIWEGKLASQSIWVAHDGDRRVGFITLGDNGYVDLAYVAAAAQGRGVFSALLAALEAEARDRTVPRLWTHASLMAQPAFIARGFHVIRHETVERSGQRLARAEMEKVLT